jgi:hypothetical protein
VNVVFHILDGLTDVTGLPISNKLQTFMDYFFGDAEYQTVAHGSSTNNSIKYMDRPGR